MFDGAEGNQSRSYFDFDYQFSGAAFRIMPLLGGDRNHPFNFRLFIRNESGSKLNFAPSNAISATFDFAFDDGGHNLGELPRSL